MTLLPLEDFYQGRTLVFAHRGARERAPENTLPAFEQAAVLGTDGVELDVQLSADGALVVIHDFSVDHTTDGTGRVAEKTLAELRQLDAGSWFAPQFAATRIPTLDEVFEALGGRLLINIELKEFSLTDRTARLRLAQGVWECIRRHSMERHVLISSFNPLALRAMRRVAPQIPIGYLYAPDLPLPLAKGWLARPLIGRHEARHPHFSMVDEAYMHWARQRGYRVNVWTVNEATDVQRMCALGVDMIISDRPDAVRHAMKGIA